MSFLSFPICREREKKNNNTPQNFYFLWLICIDKVGCTFKYNHATVCRHRLSRVLTIWKKKKKITKWTSVWNFECMTVQTFVSEWPIEWIEEEKNNNNNNNVKVKNKIHNQNGEINLLDRLVVFSFFSLERNSKIHMYKPRDF